MVYTRFRCLLADSSQRNDDPHNSSYPAVVSRVSCVFALFGLWSVLNATASLPRARFRQHRWRGPTAVHLREPLCDAVRRREQTCDRMLAVALHSTLPGLPLARFGRHRSCCPTRGRMKTTNPVRVWGGAILMATGNWNGASALTLRGRGHSALGRWPRRGSGPLRTLGSSLRFLARAPRERARPWLALRTRSLLR